MEKKKSIHTVEISQGENIPIKISRPCSKAMINSHNNQETDNIPKKSARVLTAKEFDISTMSRMRNYQRVREEKMARLKSEQKNKEEKISSFSPRQNKNDNVKGNFYERLERGQKKREYMQEEQEKMEWHWDPNLREATFSPYINKRSERLNRYFSLYF